MYHQVEPSTELSIRKIVEGTPDLPVMPFAVIQVIQLTNNSDTNAQSIANAIATDQALSARVLRLANSAFYGMPRSVSSLKEAVVVLGIRNVRNLAILASTLPWLQRPLPGYDLGPKQLLLHSLAIGTGARMIAKLAKLSSEVAETAFVAGLLADIGKIALSESFTKNLAQMVSAGMSKGKSFDEVERAVLGFDHAQVGAQMTEDWNLPEEIVDAIHHHHHPSEARSNQSLCDCLHIGVFLALTCGCGIGGDGLCYEFEAESITRLGLSSEDLDRVIDDFVVAYEHQENLLNELAG